MNISVIDASNYFKGLLLLIGKDRKITQGESALLKRVGKALGFEREFCKNAVNDILENPYIVDTLPVFSSREIAKKFILDGFVIAAVDGAIHLLEEEWLKSTAENYGLEDEWFLQEKATALQRTEPPARLEAEDLTVDYS
jgi:hypothetical protein